MPNTLSANFNGTATLYAVVRRTADGYVWNGSAFVVWVNGDIATYDIPLTSMGGDWYAADMPIAIESGTYRADYYKQAGGTPAITDYRLEGHAFYWNGSTSSDPPETDGTYWSWLGVKSILGQINAEVASQLDNEVLTADMVRVAADGATADAYTNFRAKRGDYERDTPILEADDGDFFTLVCQATNLYAAFLLARHRNWFGYTDSTKDQLVGLRGEAMDLYAELFGAIRPGVDPDPDAEPAGTFQSVPLVWEPECSEDEYAS